MSQHEESIRVLSFPSQLGWMAVALRAGGVCRLTFGHPSRRAALQAAESATSGEHKATKGASRHGAVGPPRTKPSPESRPGDAALVRRLQAYAKGAHDDFLDVHVAHDAHTPFARGVIQSCRRIPLGATVTYGQLAAKAGSPRAARAVGNVMARNPVPIIVPCHRVVGGGGSYGGYSGPQGLDMKRRLLRMEGA